MISIKVDRKNDSLEKIFDGVYGYNMKYNHMTADLKGRTALISGATGMIGGATATRFAQCGANVIVWGTRDAVGQEKVKELESYGVKAYYNHVDITDYNSIKSAFEDDVAKFGKIDICFANAGNNFTNRKPITEMDMDFFDKSVEINLNGAMYMANIILPQMVKQGGGNFVYTSSVCGLAGLMNQCGFSAAKYAVLNLTKALALEYGKYNIRVNALVPGSVPFPESPLSVLYESTNFEDYDSNFERPETLLFDVPQRRPGTPMDMAGLVVYLVSDDANYTTGQTISVDGGWACGLSGKY